MSSCIEASPTQPISRSIAHRFGERSETALARIQRRFGDTFEMPALFSRPNLKFGFVSFHHSNTSLLQSRRVARAVVLSFQFANASLGIFELSPAQIHQFGSARIGFHALFESKLALPSCGQELRVQPSPLQKSVFSRLQSGS